MKANRWGTEWLAATIERTVTRYLEQLFEINVEVEQAVNHLKSRAVEFQAWAEVFVSAKPKVSACVFAR